METLYVDHYSQFPMHYWRWDDFTPGEMASRTVVNNKRGPKGPLLIDFFAMDKLQDLRDLINKPFIVNSAYRSPEYNEWLISQGIGASPRSQHLKGTAYDISMHNHNQQEFVREAERVGFWGIGLYSTFTHIDNRGYEAFWDNR